MKRGILVVLVSVLSVIAVQAQQPMKIGYTNVNHILSNHPSSQQIEKQLQTFRKQLENELVAKYEKLKMLMDEFQKQEPFMTEPTKQSKRREIAALEEDINQFSRDADVAYANKQDVLLKPLIDEIQNAINEVAKENGYTYIFNTDAGIGTMNIMLYGPDQHNVTNLVMKKLGVAVTE